MKIEYIVKMETMETRVCGLVDSYLRSEIKDSCKSPG